jgi:hypothetical protein
MSMRRLAPLFVLLALLMAPFGRAQAQPMAHDMPAMAMGGHCDPAPRSAPPPVHHRSIDCMIACAGVPVLEASLIAPPLPPVTAMIATPVLALHGILPQFDPPPPRTLS